MQLLAGLDGDLEAGLHSRVPSSMATTACCVSACTALMSTTMSLAALPERSASFLTSSATTAKRNPDSPAPAASMAALSARRLVCEAMSSIVFTISEISSDRSARLLTFFEIPCTSPGCAACR